MPVRSYDGSIFASRVLVPIGGQIPAGGPKLQRAADLLMATTTGRLAGRAAAALVGAER
ncbi:MAG: hypothetical protein AB7P21_22620 [Lautropia sp.]